MNEFLSTMFALGFATGGIGIFVASLTFSSNYGTPEDNYRKSFDRTMECREKVKTPTNIDVICGKIPQWSEFVKETQTK
jgi:hypothetical protein